MIVVIHWKYINRVKADNIDTLGLCIPVIEVKVQTIENTDLYDRYA